MASVVSIAGWWVVALAKSLFYLTHLAAIANLNVREVIINPYTFSINKHDYEYEVFLSRRKGTLLDSLGGQVAMIES